MDLTENLVQATQKTINQTVQAFQKVTDLVMDSTKNLIQTTQKLVQNITKLSINIVNRIDSYIDSIVQTTQKLVQNITKFSLNLRKKVADGVDFVISRTKEFTNLTINQLKQLLVKAPKEEIKPPEEIVRPEIPPEPEPSKPPEVVKTDTILVRTTLGNINLDLSEKEAEVIAGKQIVVFVKPSKPAFKLEGYLLFEKISQKESSRSYFASLIIPSVSAATPVFAKTYEIQTLTFQGPDEQGFWKATLSVPPVVGEYKLEVNIDFVDGSEKDIEKIVLVDPEGYIYEDHPRGQIRVKGATVSLLVFDQSFNRYIIWPAELYDQGNPQITNETGQYSFLVPEGRYYLKVEHSDYKPYQSEPFEVREGHPVHFNVKMELESFWEKLKLPF